jgi:hypothetical protein
MIYIYICGSSRILAFGAWSGGILAGSPTPRIVESKLHLITIVGFDDIIMGYPSDPMIFDDNQGYYLAIIRRYYK